MTTDLERSLIGRVGELEAELAVATAQLAESRAAEVTLAGRVDALQGAVERARTASTAAVAAADRNAVEVARLTTAIRDQGTTVNTLLEQRHRLQAQVTQLTADLVDAHRTAGIERQRAADLTTELAGRDRQLEQHAMPRPDAPTPGDPATVQDAIYWLHTNGMHAAADGLARQFGALAG